MPHGLQPPVLPVVDPEHHWRETSPGPEGDRGLEHTAHLPWSLSRHPDGVGRPGESWTDRVYAGEAQPGPYVGRGPKGWRRTDQRLQEDVSDALTRDPHVDATDIEVNVENGEVTLLGTVTDRGQKRRAEECAERVRGVREVHNRLRLALKPG
jgi:hypothetical protein